MAASDQRAVMLIQCQDRPGLIAAVSNFVASHNGNILHADQHVDASEGTFVQRVEWDLRGFDIPRDEIADAFSPIARKFNMRWGLHFTDPIPRVGILVSRLGHCLRDLLMRVDDGDLPAQVPVIISNHPDMRASAESFGAEYCCFPVESDRKAEQEARVLAKLADHGVDLVVLARYMQILSPDFVAQYPNRIINIHHSFLPAFVGARPYHQAHSRGVKIIGATAHYVTNELDQGPIIEQDVTRASHQDSVADLVRRGKDLERMVLARAVGLHVRHQVLVYGNKTAVFA